VKGTVKWYNGHTTAGFVIGEDGKEYFLYKDEMVRTNIHRLDKGQEIEFAVKERRGRLVASDIKILTRAKNEIVFETLFARQDRRRRRTEPDRAIKQNTPTRF